MVLSGQLQPSEFASLIAILDGRIELESDSAIRMQRADCSLMSGHHRRQPIQSVFSLFRPSASSCVSTHGEDGEMRGNPD